MAVATIKLGQPTAVLARTGLVYTGGAYLPPGLLSTQADQTPAPAQAHPPTTPNGGAWDPANQTVPTTNSTPGPLFRARAHLEATMVSAATTHAMPPAHPIQSTKGLAKSVVTASSAAP